MKELKIEYLKLSDIIPYENNPRINDEAVECVANSIKEFGFKVPIIIDENNVIVAGHTRLKASEALGLDKVPCIRADDLTDEQVKAFRLADNKVAEKAEWNFEKLSLELDDLDDIEINMNDFGFDVDLDIEQPTRKISDSEEINIEDYEDGQFECECPRCGFLFNKG